MIEFSKITKTLGGYDCHYFGTRYSNKTKLYCFGVWTTTGLYEKCYDENGKHLVWSDLVGKWSVSDRPDFQIVKPPKIVEVTKWIGLYKVPDDYFISHANSEEVLSGKNLLSAFKHTFRFEVPDE